MDRALQDLSHVDEEIDGLAWIHVPAENQPVRVLFVGGNEEQARTDDTIRRRVARCDEQIEINFVRPGWNSNWNEHARDVDRLLPTHHAVVIMRYIRTNFGKHIRRKCGERNILWRFCWSGGRGGAVEAILKAARAGRE